MKLTNQRLNRIIKEEIAKALKDQRSRPKRRLAEAGDVGSRAALYRVESIRLLSSIEGVLKEILAATVTTPAAPVTTARRE